MPGGLPVYLVLIGVPHCGMVSKVQLNWLANFHISLGTKLVVPVTGLANVHITGCSPVTPYYMVVLGSQ